MRRELRTAWLRPTLLPRSKKKRIRKKWRKLHWERPRIWPRWIWYDPDVVHCWRCGVDFNVEALIECGLTGNDAVHPDFTLNRLTDPDIDPDRKLREKLKALSSTEG